MPTSISSESEILELPHIAAMQAAVLAAQRAERAAASAHVSSPPDEQPVASLVAQLAGRQAHDAFLAWITAVNALCKQYGLPPFISRGGRFPGYDLEPPAPTPNVDGPAGHQPPRFTRKIGKPRPSRLFPNG